MPSCYVIVICNLDPGIEAIACACELLYIYVRGSTFYWVLQRSTLFRIVAILSNVLVTIIIYYYYIYGIIITVPTGV